MTVTSETKRTCSDLRYRPGEMPGLEHSQTPIRSAPWATVKREVLAALARHDLRLDVKCCGLATHDPVQVYVEHPDAVHRRSFGYVRRDTCHGLMEDAEALALEAVQACNIPFPCPCCATFPLLCEHHGAENVRGLAARDEWDALLLWHAADLYAGAERDLGPLLDTLPKRTVLLYTEPERDERIPDIVDATAYGLRYLARAQGHYNPNDIDTAQGADLDALAPAHFTWRKPCETDDELRGRMGMHR